MTVRLQDCNTIDNADVYFLPFINEITHFVGKIHTASGNSFVLTVMGGRVTAHFASGHITCGTDVHVLGNTIVIRDNDEDKTYYRSTKVVRVDVYEN